MVACAVLKKALAIGPALVLVLACVWEAIAAPRDAAAVPDDAAWVAASYVVRARWRPGDLIVFAPGWIDPVGRLVLGDLISLDMAGRMDAARYARIWELSIRGARAPETRELANADSDDDIAGVHVRLYEQPPAAIATDFAAQFRTAHADGARPTLELAEVGFAPHRCIHVVPVPGKPARIAFDHVELGGELVGYAGLADVFTRRDVRAPGDLAVEIDGKVAASAHVGVDDGWVRFAAPTMPGAHDVAFVARADAPQRLICFAAEARK